MHSVPVWDLRDVLPWWLLVTSTVLAFAGFGVVAVRQRSAAEPGSTQHEDPPLTD